MIEQESLFDLSPDEKFGELEDIDIEYIQIAMEREEKKTFYIMCEEIIKSGFFEKDSNKNNYSDLIYYLIERKYNDIKSEL
jgi:hypothetical protein